MDLWNQTSYLLSCWHRDTIDIYIPKGRNWKEERGHRSQTSLTLLRQVPLDFFKNFIGIQLIYNVVLVSDVQHSKSVIHVCISTLSQILFPYRPLQNIEQSPCSIHRDYTVGPYQSIYFICSTVYMSVQVSQLIPPFLSPQ